MQDEIKNLLQFSDCHSILTTEGIAELYKFMQKENKLKEVCNLDRIKIRPDDGRNYIYINRKQIIGIDRADLINKLYDYFLKLHSTDFIQSGYVGGGITQM